MADVLDDFVSRVREIVGENADIMVTIEEAEMKTRFIFGGSPQYISKNIDINLRRERAKEALAKGQKVVDIVKSSRLGEKEIYKLKRASNS